MRWFIAIGLVVLLGCQKRREQQKPVLTNEDSIRQEQAGQEEENDVQQEKYKKYWGYWFHIQGDFDGDGKQETLTEKLISKKTGQEIAKFCGFEENTVPDCMWTWRINQYRQPRAFLECSNQAIESFTGIDSLLTIGFEFVQNVGDLNGDKTDEIAYVKDYGGCNSGFRGMNLATFKNGKWKDLMNFTTRLGAFLNFEEEEMVWIATPEDLSKLVVKQFEQKLKEEPPIFKKKGQQVFYKEYETTEPVLKRLKINW